MLQDYNQYTGTNQLVDTTLYGLPDAFSQGSGGNEDTEVERLLKMNELYKQMAPEWSLYLDSYEGGVDFANSQNLFKHYREDDTIFEGRLRRLHYVNHIEPLISFFTNFIFAETIQLQRRYRR